MTRSPSLGYRTLSEKSMLLVREGRSERCERQASRGRSVICAAGIASCRCGSQSRASAAPALLPCMPAAAAAAAAVACHHAHASLPFSLQHLLIDHTRDNCNHFSSRDQSNKGNAATEIRRPCFACSQSVSRGSRRQHKKQRTGREWQQRISTCLLLWQEVSSHLRQKSHPPHPCVHIM